MEATVAEAARLMGGEASGAAPDAVWSGASLDSRTLGGGELFFAVEGERVDGHDYVSAALAGGAAAAVIHRPTEAAGGTIRVPDTVGALHDLTRAMRRRAPEHLVAVTGSAGKTTTKELLAAMLGRRYRVARSPGNLNNLYGFPLALLGIPDDTEWMVAEMGMSTPGELGRVSRLGAPDVAVFTNVRAVHLEFFDGLRGIAAAKAELLEGLSAGGLVVANGDDPEVRWIAGRHPGEVAFFGDAPDCVSRAEALVEDPAGGGSRFRWVLPEGELDVRLSLHGAYNVSNFLAAATCAWKLGVPAEDVATAAAGAEPADGRGVVRRARGGALVVDDSYNSNPAARLEALGSAGAMEGERHWAVLGDMLELGPTGADLHRQCGAAAAKAGFSPVLGVGELARHLVEGAREAGGGAEWFPSAEGVRLPELLAGDVVLVKGSRGVGLEAVVRRLTEGERA